MLKLLSTLNNEKSFLLYKFSKHSLFKQCVQLIYLNYYLLNIAINILIFSNNYFLFLKIFIYL